MWIFISKKKNNENSSSYVYDENRDSPFICLGYIFLGLFLLAILI